MPRIATYRAGTPRRPGDGLRIGTVRFLPRGVPKRDWARRGYFDVWFPNLAPSRELIRWFKAQPWSPVVQRRFFARYERELRAPEAAHALELLAAVAARTPITVGCYCEDERQCHRLVLARRITALMQRGAGA